MKKIFIIFLLMATFGFTFLLGEEMTLDQFKNIVKNVTLADYAMNTSLTRGSRFLYTVTYTKGEGLQQKALIIKLLPKSDKFSQIDLAMKPVKLTWQGREALFHDGSKTGMSSIIVILKNKVGRFSITHRTYDGSALKQAQLEDLLKKVDLENLEK